MVIQRGLVAIANEIKQRINACVPTAYSTDTFVEIDKDMREGENDLPIDQWRRYYVTMRDMDKGSFDGNYVYSNKTVGVTVHILYSESGANRVIGTPDVDFDALALQDVDDIEKALRGHIWTDDGCSARLLFSRSSVSSDGVEAEISVDFEMPVFLRGTEVSQSLFIGPDAAHTLNEGNTFYLVACSDLACTATLASSPAGCTHEGEIILGSGTPQIIVVTCSTANTYTFNLSTTAGGSDTCEVQVYPASDFVLVGPDIAIPNDVWTYNLAVAAASDGVLDVSGSANLTLPENVTIVNNKGVIPVTITARGSHNVTVGNDTCNFASATPATTIPYYNNYYYQIDPAFNSNSPSCTIVSSGCGDYAIVETPDLSGNLYFTFAYRYKPVYSTLSTTGAWIYAGAGQSAAYANWAIGNYTYLTRPVIWYRNYENTANNTHYLNTPYLTLGNWYDIVFSYTYNINTQTGTLNQYINGNLQNVIALGASGRMGYVHNDAVRLAKTIQALYIVSGQFQFYDMYISNNYAWNNDDATAFSAKSTIDPDHYTLYWPLQKNTDLPYLVDYDRKNGVPLYIPGPHPEIEWVPKP